MTKYSELDASWQINKSSGTYCSPEIAVNRMMSGQHMLQRLIFSETLQDGTINANIEIRNIKVDGGGTAQRDANLIFRYQNPSSYYFAGLGGNYGRFAIAKMSDGQPQTIKSFGDKESIEYDVPYTITISFQGNKISLAHNGITHFEAFDNSFRFGQWGLQTNFCYASFHNISRTIVHPKCFVIMPFSEEFNEVFEVIKQTVEEQQFECVRADERYLVGPIIEDISKQIEDATLIIADLTGKNPNVYYEVGYAAALRKRVIQIAQSAADLPFDVRHLRTFQYSTRILGDRKLAKNLREAILTNS